MLLKRVLDGRGSLKKATEGVGCNAGNCAAQVSLNPSAEACQECLQTRFIEAMRVILLSLIIWTGMTYGGVIMPYSFNLIPGGVMYPPPTYDYPFPSCSVLKKLPKINEKHINESLQFGQMSINSLERLESNLERSKIQTEIDTPSHGQWIAGYLTDEGNILHKFSWTVTKASSFLSHAHCGRFGVSEEECASYVSTLSLQNSDIGKTCISFHHPACLGSKKYRSYDGSCNNMKRTSWGQALTGFKRILHPRYANGIDKPRTSIKKKPLPSARLISSSISTDINVPDSKHSLALMQWGQFVEHDLIHIPLQKMIHYKNSITCCDRSGGDLSPRYKHPSCLSLNVLRKDIFYGPHWISCLPYTRSATTFRGDCTFGAAEQMNQASHFLDGSHIYGSNSFEAISLREQKGGLMKVENLPHGAFLPLLDKSKRREMCQLGDEDDTCFKSGDVRVNIHPHLTTMHTIWLREHNRIAENLALLNPTWGDEILYQEARRIVIAQLQHITYEHWLPELIGKSVQDSESYDIGYNPEIDPSIANSVATAGMRFLNSLLDGTLNLVNEDRTINETYELVDHFNRPHIVKVPGKFEQIVRGLITQRSQSMDLHFADDIIQQLYSPKNKKVGLDILSLDIQKGRDHGIPPYYMFREICNLNPGNDFDDFKDTFSDKTVDLLKKIYSHAHDVDLIVGALAEQPSEGMLLGPTFNCLLREQFDRTRFGDRYYYNNIEQPIPFTHQQLEQIKKTSLSRIICNNVPEIIKIQTNAFKLADSSNDYKLCNGSDIKKVNLAAWQDPEHKPNLLTRTKKNVGKWIKNSS